MTGPMTGSMIGEAESASGPLGTFHPPLALRASPERVRARFWPALWRAAGRIPFAEDVAAAWYCALDPRTPARVKAVLFGALAYFILPADMVPDVLVGIGFTDDATVLATALGVVGAHVKPRHRASARRRLERPEPPEEEESS